MEAKTSEWRPGPTVCRCCLTEGCYKDISTEYFWMGKREVYAEMLADTLNLTIAYSQSGGPNSNSRLICEPCISRLRDAADFKRQVQECEKTFLQHLDPSTSGIVAEDVSRESILKGKQVKIELVKLEKDSDDDDFEPSRFTDDDDVDDDIDDQPLTKLAKTPKKETVDLLDLIDNAKVAEKRKSTTKVKATPVKKAKQKKDTKATANQDKPEKKKKGSESPCEDQKDKSNTGQQKKKRRNIILNPEILKERKKNSTLILEAAKLCPFRWMKNLFICFYCDQQFLDPDTLREHNNLEHSTPSLAQIEHEMSKQKKHEFVKVELTNVSCKICNHILHDIPSLKYHLMDRHDMYINSNDGILPFKISKDNFVCILCSTKFETFKSLNHHMNVHFQNYICEQCGSGFITPDRLRAHSVIHVNGSFPCEECHKVFRSNTARTEHIANIHKKCKRHRCPECHEGFRNYFQRNKHISSVHGMTLKEFKCDLCPRVFNLSGKLRVHFRTVHLKMKRYTCEVCDWKFYSKSELKFHMIKHGGERKYQCNVCKKAYARKYTLTEHMRIHDNDRRYACGECGRSFVQNCSLKHHIKVHHPNIVKMDASFQDEMSEKDRVSSCSYK
ncbi:PREDICTED: zinc finger protein 675 isoform X4 [Papilio xuthus]|uniref:Zinc finger protein 675 isoform X4 n=1 Tax=Papilio xuthus TaxID=66420 RepID=A0AAJ6Z240_PAPXU|nr:PREDICTED: zinc finger protein 675 isoform X4 [Papilio xuthus]